MMTTLVLEIVPGSEPIEGVLCAPDGSSRKFTGTLGLLAAIEAMREPPAPPDVSPRGEELGAPT
jgi:hypothetical protein